MSKGKWLDEKQIRKIESDTWKKCMILSTAYLMDEFDYDEDKIIAYYKGLTRYVDSVKKRTISMQQVCDIIEKHTNLKITWEGK